MKNILQAYLIGWLIVLAFHLMMPVQTTSVIDWKQKKQQELAIVKARVEAEKAKWELWEIAWKVEEEVTNEK